MAALGHMDEHRQEPTALDGVILELYEIRALAAMETRHEEPKYAEEIQERASAALRTLGEDLDDE